MKTGTFTGFDLELRDPGIAWFQFNSPERLNGMTTAIKRDLIADLGELHFGRRTIQPAGRDIRVFYDQARSELRHDLLEVDPGQAVAHPAGHRAALT